MPPLYRHQVHVYGVIGHLNNAYKGVDNCEDKFVINELCFSTDVITSSALELAQKN